MNCRRLAVASLIPAFLSIVLTVAGPAQASAAPRTSGVDHQPVGSALETAGGRSARLGTPTLSGLAVLNDVPDDQVSCSVSSDLPHWSPRPTVNWTVGMQCNGRWASGIIRQYLYYRFNQNDTWQLANSNNISLPGGNSSTLVLQGINYTTTPCFPAYWFGRLYVQVTFYAGYPRTCYAWFYTAPDQFLSC